MPAIGKKEGERPRPQKLSGKWDILEMSDLPKEYLSHRMDPHIKLTLRGKRVRGHYEYGESEGELEGEVVAREGSGPLEIVFSFDGVGEMAMERGYGRAVLSDDGMTLTGKLHVHTGGDYMFTCMRSLEE